MSNSKSKSIAKSVTTEKVSAEPDSFTVKLSSLSPSPKNVRRYQSEAGLAELKASISAHGLIQNLRVRAVENGKFQVVAGARRLRALKELQKAGGTIKGRKVTPSHLVRVGYQEEDDNDAEISLAENTQRENMHPADEAVAFSELVETEGMTPEQIADRFGISHMTVRRRLKLAHVSPRILEAFRAGEATQEQVEALAISDDHSRQEAAFFDAPSWQVQPTHLRQRLTDAALPANAVLARFVGVEAYEAAGGAIIRDLFSAEGTTFLADRDLLYRLAGEKLQPLFDELKSEGWKWAEYVQGWPGQAVIYPQTAEGDYSPEDQAALDALDAAQEALNAEWEEAEESEDEGQQEVFEARQQAINQQIAEVDARYEAFNREEMAFGGAAVQIGQDGSITVQRGIVKGDDMAAWRAFKHGTPPEDEDDDDQDDEDADSIDAPAPTEEVGPAYSMVVIEDLTAYKTAVIAVEMAKRPNVALIAAVHSLALSHFRSGSYNYHRQESACQLRNGRPAIRVEKMDPANQAAFVEQKKLAEYWQARIPENPGDLWGWLLEQRPNVVLDLFAYLVGQTMDAWRCRHQSGPRFAQADAVAAALGVDMVKWWEPSDSFFQRVPKAVAIEAVRQIGKPEELAKGLAKDAKADAISAALHELAGSGWLPAPLRLTKDATQTSSDEGDEAGGSVDDEADASAEQPAEVDDDADEAEQHEIAA